MSPEPEFDFEALKATERLPSPPGVALSILQLVEREDADAGELAKLVQADPALSARLLRFANSPMVAPRRPIVATQEAVIRIGLHGVRNLVLGLSLVGHYRTGKCEAFDYDRFWAGSLALGVAASILTAETGTAAPEESFTVGLLGEIGRLALATAWPDEYAMCLRETNSEEDLIESERKRFTIDHPGLTCLLLRDWGLPEIFIEALRLSRAPPPTPKERREKMAWLLALARDVRAWCLAEESERPAICEALQRHWETPPFELPAPDDLLPRVEGEWHAWGKLIEIPTRFPRKQAPARRKPAEKKAELPGLKILLVDDDPMLLLRLSKQLKQAGHRVDTAKDGETALQRILEEPPQVVITDWHMRPVDGLQLCRTLRDTPLGERLYLIMLTASESEDELVQAFDAGIDDYVTKPVSLRVLLARIRAAQRIVSLQTALEREHALLEQRAKELALANRKLEQMAYTDALTGLPNRRYALKRLTQELAEARRSGLPLSVILLDLDHFKRINDTLGHEAGDRALAHTAAVLRQTLRVSDVACRFGGEEFLIIAPNTPLKSAAQLAERIRHALETHPAELPEKHALTASLGVACVKAGESAEHLLRRADAALYHSKNHGRNRVTASR